MADAQSDIAYLRRRIAELTQSGQLEKLVIFMRARLKSLESKVHG